MLPFESPDSVILFKGMEFVISFLAFTALFYTHINAFASVEGSQFIFIMEH